MPDNWVVFFFSKKGNFPAKGKGRENESDSDLICRGKGNVPFCVYFYCSASQLLVNLILFDHCADILHMEKHLKAVFYASSGF